MENEQGGAEGSISSKSAKLQIAIGNLRIEMETGYKRIIITFN